MESESKSINVNEPFLSQQAFRDFIKLPSEEPVPKIGLRDLLEVVKVVIKHELNCCGCSEKELIGCRLEYTIPKEESQELRESYSIEWSHIPQSEMITEDEEEISKESPLSSEFMGKLTQRFDEMSSALDGAKLTGTDIRFRTFRNSDCIGGFYPFGNLSCEGWVCNGGEHIEWKKNRGKMICVTPQNKPPD
jgi:hypothetical protein